MGRRGNRSGTGRPDRFTDFALPLAPLTWTMEQLLEEHEKVKDMKKHYRPQARPTPVLDVKFVVALYRASVSPLTTTCWGVKLDTEVEVYRRAWGELCLPPAEAAFPPFDPTEDPRGQGFRPFGFGPVAAHLGLALGQAPCDKRPDDAYLLRQIPFIWYNMQWKILNGYFRLGGCVGDLGRYMERVQRVSDLAGHIEGTLPRRLRCCLCEQRELVIPGLQERSEADSNGWEELVVSRLPSCHHVRHVFGRNCFEKFCFDIKPDGSKEAFCPICRAKGRSKCFPPIGVLYLIDV